MSPVRRVALLSVVVVAATLAPVASVAAAAPAAAHDHHDHAQAGPAGPAGPGKPELVGTYQRLAKDLIQPDGSLRDVYSDVLVTGSGTYRLRLPKGRRIEGGTPVRVRGTLAGQDLTADEVTVLGAPAATHASGTTKVLVVLVHWSQPDSVTLAHARNQVFTDDHGWFGEASYGGLGLTGDATGWHQIVPPTNGQCWAGYAEIMSRAKEKALAAGYDPALYDRTMVYFPACGGDAAGVAGWAYQPGSEVWLNGYFDRRVSVHEQGHNYGLAHAHTLHCSSGGAPVSLSTSCSMVEYGDDYDAMGGSMYAAHFSAPQKDRLGWLAGGRKRVLTSAETTFTLPPFETAGATPLAAVADAGVAGRQYWVEYRRPTGYDAALPAGATEGVLVRMTDSAVTGDDGPALLDMTPLADFGDAVIPPGGAWTSPEGVRISVGAAGPAGAEVTVRGGADPATVPSAPRNVVATAGDGAVRLSWDPPESNGGATVQSYRVVRTPGNVTTTVTGATATIVGGLANGTEYAFAVAATNTAGTGPAAALVTATPAPQLPSATVTAPAGGATVGGLVDLAATATPHPVSGAPIAFVAFAVDGVEVDWDSDAPYTGRWDSSRVPDGPHAVTATAYDTNDRFGTSEPVTVTVSSARPTVTITSPAGGAVVTDDIVTLEATAAPVPGGAPIDSVLYELADGTPVGFGSATAPHTAFWDTSSLNGVYTVVAKAYDGDGRVGTSEPVTITLQHPIPDVALTAPADGATVQGVVTVGADATPSPASGAAVEQVEFRVDGGYLGTDTEAPYAVEWDTGALSGPHVLTAVAYDAAGRSATSASRTVTVDNPAPTVTVTSPGEGDTVSGLVTFSAAPVAAASPVVRVVFTVDGWLDLGAPAAPGPYTVQWDARDFPGEHTVVATVHDAAGRSGESPPVAFTVRTPAPTAVFTQPADGAVLRSGPAALALAAAPDTGTGSPVVSATFSVDGVPVGTDTEPADGFGVPWTATLGSHWLTAEVVDADGFAGYARPVGVEVADPPGPPTGVTAQAGGNATATVTWTPPTSTGGYPVTEYVVRASDGTEHAAAGSPFVVTGLANGTAYTFRVRARTAAGDGEPSAASNAVKPGTALTASVSATTVDYGRAVTTSGTLTGGGTPLSGRRVQLLACAPGTLTCTAVASATTSDVGRVAIAYVPTRHRDLRLRYVATDATLVTTTSAARAVRVRAVVNSAISTTTMRLGRTATVTGRVAPAHDKRTVYLQRLTGSGWKTVASGPQSSTGYVSFAVKPAAKGTYYYRLYFAGDSDHLAGTSARRSVRVY